MLRIVAYRSVLAVLDGFLGHGFLVSVNRLKERQAALFVSLVLLATLSTLFGYWWGAAGVATALFISDAILIVQYLFISSRIGMRIFWPSVTPSLLAGAAMLACAFAIPRDIMPVLRFSIVLLAYLSALSMFSRGRLMDAGRTLQECIR